MLFLCTVISGPFFPALASEKLFSLNFGAVWPSITSQSWNGEFIGATFIDRQIGFGIAADILWNKKTEAQQNGVVLITTKEESYYMIPVMGTIVFDPLPGMLLHPQFKAAIGYNSLFYTLNAQDRDPAAPKNGYYYGLIVKIGADGLYNLGEQSAIYFGLDYQWAELKQNTDIANHFYYRDMGGLGLHIGFRFLH
jgi:hypothetical protein